MPTDRMQPLTLLGPDRLRRVQGVLTDIDDTLTRDGAIEPAGLDALQRLRANAIPVIAITGRPVGWSEPFALQWPVAAIVAENGGVMLRATPAGLQCEFAQGAVERARNSERLRACATAVLHDIEGTELAADSAGRLTDIAIDHSEFKHLDDARIQRVVTLMRRHGLNATVSSIHVNGWIGNHTKWTGAQWAVERLTGAKLRPDDWLYIGDSTNDQLMFKHIPLSVAVANIARFVPMLEVLPAYVTQAERGVGFAEMVQALLAARCGP